MKKQEWRDVEQSGSFDEGDRPQKQDDTEYSSSSMNDGNGKSSKRRVEDEEAEAEGRDDTSSMKKRRVVWSDEFHKQFVVAVNQLGIDKAVPKKILELMNAPGITRDKVASHLQKYRQCLRNRTESSGVNGVSHHQV